MTPAGNRVAHIPELLEHILLLLLEDFDSDHPQTCRPTYKTVLASQRTCFAFSDTIAGSNKLQKALMFVEPCERPTTHASIVNPIAKIFFECYPSDPSWGVSCKDWQTPHYSLWVNGSGDRASKNRRIESSFRKMYLLSEPHVVIATSTLHADGARRLPTFVLKNPTLGEILDIAHGRRMLVRRTAIKKREG